MSDFLCPECKGTGVYQGLNTVEPCRACGGLQGGILVPPDIAKAVMDAARENRVIVGEPFAPVSLTQKKLNGQVLYSPEMVQDFENAKLYRDFIRDELARSFGEGMKPFDEVCPAEWEGLSVGRTVAVHVECEDCFRPFMAAHRFIDRPLFGLPSRSFRIIGAAVGTLCHTTGKREVTAELLYKPPCDEDRFTMMNSAGEVVSEQWLYESDPCQDMLFIPILED